MFGALSPCPMRDKQQPGNQALHSSRPSGGASVSLPGLELWAYRVGIYLLLSFMDDPAWLAFWFC